jgi:hypothetical protein
VAVLGFFDTGSLADAHEAVRGLEVVGVEVSVPQLWRDLVDVGRDGHL